MTSPLHAHWLQKILASSQGAVVTGSAAWGDASKANDVDIVVVAGEEGLEPLLARSCAQFNSDLEPRTQYMEVAHSFKGYIDQDLFSLWTFPKTYFERAVDTSQETIDYIRNTPNQGEVDVYSLDGSIVSAEVTNYSGNDGLVIAREPNFLKSDVTLVGIFPDALIKAPRVISDRDGLISRTIQELWKNLYAALTRESSQEDVEALVRTGDLPLLGKQQHHEKLLRDHVREQLYYAQNRC